MSINFKLKDGTIRTFNEDLHGKDYKAIAKEFSETNGLQPLTEEVEVPTEIVEAPVEKKATRKGKIDLSKVKDEPEPKLED